MTVCNTVLLDVWWNMLIKFSKQIANGFVEVMAIKANSKTLTAWNVQKYGLSLILIFPDIDRIVYVFSVFGQNSRFCANTEKYKYDSAHIWGNTDQRKPVFWHISGSGFKLLAKQSNSQKLKAVHYFYKNLHIWCLTRFWIWLRIGFQG